jgi:dienelactone hydrolase
VLVLRYDKRSRALPRTLNPATVTVKEEIIDDVLAAVNVLRRRKDIDTSRISIIGHSLGAMLAPEIAKYDRRIKGIAMLAAAARPLEDVIEDQLRYTASLPDSLSASEQKTLQTQLQSLAGIRRGELPGKTVVLSAPANYYYDLHKRHWIETAKTLSIPIFLATAGKDYQVTAKDAGIWKAALQGKPNVRSFTCDSCFHLFIEAPGKPAPSNYDIESNVTVDLIRDLALWAKRK